MSPRTIVVGVDGSEGSRAALQWAIAEAERRDARLHLVHAWQYPYMGEYAAFTNAPFTAAEEGAALLMKAAVEEAKRAGAGEVTSETHEGPPARVLLDAAADAELLVLGSRGRGGFAGLLLGSVSMQCAHHAPCPLVIVPKVTSDTAR